MNRYRVLGIMSGTSLDGVDLALCVFEKKGKRWTFSIEKAETVPYQTRQAKKFSDLGESGAEEFAAEHTAYGRFLGELAKRFLAKHKARPDFIASHGHTIFHQPSKRFSTQIGDGAALSAASGFPVVCDFRSADIALGGQGAPLVPVGDQLLFESYEYCLNLGGIANISFEKSGRRKAYDICPVNIVLNRLAQEKKKAYDADGKLASQGRIHEDLLEKLNAISFYRRPFPKSLGREDIEKHFFPLLDKHKSSVEDKLRTFCEHIAVQIASAAGAAGRMLITGGGAYNSFLIGRIRHHAQPECIVPAKQVIEFKEALIFAFLGVLRWRGEINCLGSVTGASRDSSGGAIYNP